MMNPYQPRSFRPHPAVFSAICALLLGSLSVPILAQEASGTSSTGGRASRVAEIGATLQRRIDDEHWTKGQGASACGIYAACRSLELLGIEANPGRYFTVDYLANSEGSTPGEIAKIIESERCRAVPMVNLSKLDIVATGLPVIANVRSPGIPIFDHWVCVVFVDGGLKVFDGAAPAVAMSFADFLSLWNGYGIVVSPIDQPIVAAIWASRIGAIAILIGVGLTVHVLATRIRPARLRATVGLAGACLALAVLGNLAFGDVPHLMSGVRLAASSGHSKISGREFESIPERDLENYVLIDARYFDTYRMGAIKGSINIPVDTPEIALKGLFEGVDRNVPLLVYCHSASCGYDSVIAGKLTSLGFRDVNVSREGWVEYSAARNGSSSPDDSGSAQNGELDEASL